MGLPMARRSGAASRRRFRRITIKFYEEPKKGEKWGFFVEFYGIMANLPQKNRMLIR
jgi:hypothetical protein